MPTITINGDTLFYEVYDQRSEAAGEQVPLLLIHGAGGHHLHWPAHLRRLADCLVYALDLPGHGRSGGRAQASIAAYRQVVTEVMAELALPRAVIAGHSMGGAIALELALATPERVAGLVLVSTGARLRVHPSILQGLQQEFAATTAQLIEWMYAPHYPAAQRQRALEQLRTNPPTELLADFQACDTFDCRTQLPTLPQPTLIICGTLDQMTPVTYSTYLHQAIAGSDLQTIEGIGHMAMVEAPEAVIELVARFMAGL